MQFVYSTSGGISLHPSSELPMVVQVNQGQHLDLVLMELIDSMLIEMNDSFTFGGDGIFRYQDKICVPDVDDLRTRIVT